MNGNNIASIKLSALKRHNRSLKRKVAKEVRRLNKISLLLHENSILVEKLADQREDRNPPEKKPVYNLDYDNPMKSNRHAD